MPHPREPSATAALPGSRPASRGLGPGSHSRVLTTADGGHVLKFNVSLAHCFYKVPGQGFGPFLKIALHISLVHRWVVSISSRRESSPRDVCRDSLRLPAMESSDDKTCLLQCSLIRRVFPLGWTPVVSRLSVSRLPREHSRAVPAAAGFTPR